MTDGERNSSLTRVQPVFTQLCQKDQTGLSWLGKVLSFGTRARQAQLPEQLGWTGTLKSSPQFEYSAYPPVEYLEHLITHPERLQGECESCSEETVLKRHRLLEGDRDTLEEALELLHQKPRATKKWWVFEGITKVDCALFAENVTVFVEGKRTETDLKQPTQWDPKRLQIFRNLDCLQALDSRVERFYMLLVVEEGNEELVSRAKDLDGDFTAAKESWPHLTDEQAEELWSHYLGFTTWEQIKNEFGIVLPDTRDEAEEMGLTAS